MMLSFKQGAIFEVESILQYELNVAVICVLNEAPQQTEPKLSQCRVRFFVVFCNDILCRLHYVAICRFSVPVVV